VLDVSDRQVYVFRQPEENAYRQETIIAEDTTISLLAFPEVEVQVSQLFPG
jgi:Uma2 family endonuclease